MGESNLSGPRTVGCRVLGCAVFLFSCLGWLTSKGASAEQIRELAQSADWQLVKVDDPFAETPIQCQIRTRTVQAGGRRERPLIIFDVTSQRIIVRPDRGLQGSVQANRALKGDTGDRGGRQEVVVRHGIRIDGGKLHSVEVRDEGANTLEVNFDKQVYAALANEAREGKTIYYLWAVATSRKAFEFPLDGLRQLLPTARQECAKPIGR